MDQTDITHPDLKGYHEFQGHYELPMVLFESGLLKKNANCKCPVSIGTDPFFILLVTIKEKFLFKVQIRPKYFNLRSRMLSEQNLITFFREKG
jgi:hypothetical protein